MSDNPLVAGRDDHVDAWAGVWIAEDIESICAGVKNGSWVDGSLGVLGFGLDGLAVVTDPVGVLLQYGVAWIIEHVRPLSEALDWLAGDPAQITANARTWSNIAGELRQQSEIVARDVHLDLSEWSGAASEAYRAHSQQQQGALTGLAKAADAMAVITEGAGVLISTVRLLVRDAIAMCVSRLIVYAAEEAASFGIATPLVVEQVTTTVAAWAAKISRYLKALLASLRKLLPIIRRLGELIDDLKSILGRLRRSDPEGAPKDPRGLPPKIGGPGEFDPQELKGLSPDDVRARIPSDWDVRPSKRGGGTVYSDPENRGRQIRIMPGYPPGSRPDPLTWGPYVEVSQNGVTTKLPLAGNPTLGSP